MLAKAKSGKNTNLAARIEAFDIGRRILLGVTVILSQFESVLKAHRIKNHLGKNEIRRAVEYAGNLGYLIRGKALNNWAQNRNSAADARLKHEVYIILPCQFKQDIALFGNKLLV